MLKVMQRVLTNVYELHNYCKDNIFHIEGYENVYRHLSIHWPCH